MKYLLDTNVCIRYLNGRSDGIRRMLEARAPGDVALCSVVKAELLYGVLKSARPQRNMERVASSSVGSLACLLTRRPPKPVREPACGSRKLANSLVRMIY